jgi:hypothetical protein
MTFPIIAPASGSYPINTSWGATATFANTDQNNTNGVANYAWGGVDTAATVARVATTGAETYTTITSGSVVLISGTAIDGVTVAVNDVVLIKDCPASAGAGTPGSTQPGNGLYYVTGLSGGIQVSRCATMSSGSAVANPAGRTVFVRSNAGVGVNGCTMWQVVSPSADAVFTYGTTAMQWAAYTFGQASINNFNFANQSQTVSASVAYYVTNSNLKMPLAPLIGMVANRTTFVWNLTFLKTAAGTTGFNIIIYRGTNGTSADTADILQAVGTQTAAIDTLNVTVQVTITIIGGVGVGAYYWSITADNRAGTATGFGVPVTGVWTGTKTAVATNTTGLQFGIGFSSTLGTPTITIPMVAAYAYNMS